MSDDLLDERAQKLARAEEVRGFFVSAYSRLGLNRVEAEREAPDVSIVMTARDDSRCLRHETRRGRTTAVVLYVRHEPGLFFTHVAHDGSHADELATLICITAGALASRVFVLEDDDALCQALISRGFRVLEKSELRATSVRIYSRTGRAS